MNDDTKPERDLAWICRLCNGSGMVRDPEAGPDRCERCLGSGLVLNHAGRRVYEAIDAVSDATSEEERKIEIAGLRGLVAEAVVAPMPMQDPDWEEVRAVATAQGANASEVMGLIHAMTPGYRDLQAMLTFEAACEGATARVTLAAGVTIHTGDPGTGLGLMVTLDGVLVEGVCSCRSGPQGYVFRRVRINGRTARSFPDRARTEVLRGDVMVYRDPAPAGAA